MNREYLKRAQRTPSTDHADVRETVQTILDDIEAGGDEAAMRYAAKFDQYEGAVLLDADAIKAASDAVPEQLKKDIEFAHDNVRRFAEV